TRFLQEGNEKFGRENIPDPCDDMEAFYYLTGGPQPISQALQTILDHLDEIKMLIEIYHLVPFPIKPKLPYEFFYETRYDSGRQMQAVSRAIFLCPALIGCWQRIGYEHITDDTNEYVIQGAMLMLYPC